MTDRNEDLQDCPECNKSGEVERGVSFYAWEPKGHGEYSFIVAAKSESEAKDAVEQYIKDHIGKDDDHYLDDYNIRRVGRKESDVS